jgi:glycogen debranching enzyme
MPERAGCRKRRWTQQDMPEAVAGPIGPSMIPVDTAASEGADGEKPFMSRGCVAQAWSVAEVLRCWVKTSD